MESLAWVAAVTIAYGLVSRRLSRTSVTAPMVFVAAGIVLGDAGLGVVDLGFGESGVRLLAEATLVLVLFADATAIDVKRLTHEAQLPARLLLVALPLIVVAGAGAAMALFADLGIWSAALLAAVLAPTDAALGQAVVTSRDVPARMRDTLSVESGLNDGIALPFVTLFLGLAAEQERGQAITAADLVRTVGEQIGFGLLVGVAAGLAGGWLIRRAVERKWIDGVFQQLSTLSVAVLAFAVADLVGGNGFIAAFTAGVAFGRAASEQCARVADFTEDEGQLLALLTFLFFGATLAGPALGEFSFAALAYAVLSLTLVRMLPVAAALLGTGLDLNSMAFVGWFGPRGLASILFAVLVVEEGNLPLTDELLTIVSWTVLLSVYAHGLTARPVAAAYGRHASAMPGSSAPHRPVSGRRPPRR